MGQQLRIKKTHPNATMPERASDGAAAVDLYVALDAPVVIMPGEIKTVSTGIAIELPSPDTVALVISRSSLGYRNGVSLINSVGVIDSDYRGTINLCLVNHSDTPFKIENGDRLAQLLVTNALPLTIVETDMLSDTARGEKGFGSTGKKEIIGDSTVKERLQ